MTGILPHTPEWHEARRRNVGSSEIAALFGCQADYQMSLFRLWHVKAGKAAEPTVEGERPEWGRRLENVIAGAAAEEYGWALEDGVYMESPDTPGLGCTPDKIIIMGREKKMTQGILEIKNADWLIHKRQWTDGEPPLHISLQLQHQLAVTGLIWGAVVCLVGGNHLERYDFEARPKMIAEIKRRVDDFWQSIRENRPPPPDGSIHTAAVLAEMFPGQRELTLDVTGDNELGERMHDLKQARLDKAAGEAAERAAANWILNRVGNAEIMMSHGETILTAKSINRRGYTVEPTTYRSLKIIEG